MTEEHPHPPLIPKKKKKKNNHFWEIKLLV